MRLDCRLVLWLLAHAGAAAALLAVPVASSSAAAADALAAVRARGELVWGADREGGGPYVYPDPEDPRRVAGFEVELAEQLARELGVRARFFQGPWDNLPALLKTGQIDVVLNGYEMTPGRLGAMECTHPYYIYQLVLLARKDDRRINDWDDLGKSRSTRLKLGVLSGSAAYEYLVKNYGGQAEVIAYQGNTDAMREVETGKLDATVADLPVTIFYRDRFPALRAVGEPRGRGYYGIFLRKGERPLRDALNAALVRLLERGEVRKIYERYDLWSEAQEELLPLARSGKAAAGIKAVQWRGWAVIKSRGPLLLRAAWVTIVLACLSMPIAIVVGLGVALARLYGPAPLRWCATVYVELLRGTPLMLQLFVIFFLLPEIGIRVAAFWAAIAGLAINYSAYEAEIYRAGIQAIPRGQMEAALALGMTPALALRRIIVPQAMRIVIPPVTSDFIALFKDTSVCSAITVIELSKEYSIQVNDTGATLELAALTALLYLAMSVPLAHVAKRLETRLRAAGHR